MRILIIKCLPVSIFVLAVFAISSPASAQSNPPITKANWQQHPKIVEIRDLVQKINEEEKEGLLTVRKREFEYCQPGEDVLRVLAKNKDGRPLRYERQGGSDDSSLTFVHYYDESSGRVRFIFIHGGATNGSKLEHRIYFDDAGKRLWEDHKYTAGAGYTFPTAWPEDELQKTNPQAAFDAESPCNPLQRFTTSTPGKKASPKVVAQPTPDLWLGRYEFGEDGGKTAGGGAIFIVHTLVIERQAGKLVAKFDSNGYQTSRHLICEVVIAGNRLQILFEKDNPDEPSMFEEFEKGDLLFTLERRKRGARWVILTFWDKFKGSARDWPSGRTYFTKEK